MLKIKCLECGREFVRPLSHVWQVHKITARHYKEKHGLDLKRGICTEEYRDRMRVYIEKYNISEQLQKAGERSRFKKGDKALGKYHRSAQTFTRLRKHWHEVAKRTGREPVQKIKINCAICGKEKEIYPRYVIPGRNFCGTTCRNRGLNQQRGLTTT